MRVLVEYIYKEMNKVIKATEIKEYDTGTLRPENGYPYCIGKVLKEYHERGHEVINIRNLDESEMAVIESRIK